jgi:hypothetical protein
MQPISPKAGPVTAGARQALAEGHKAGSSKFDLLRADLNQKLAGNSQLAPQITPAVQQQQGLLRNNLREKLATAPIPAGSAGGDVNQLRAGIADLSRKVAAAPDVSAFDPLRERLKTIEADFNASAKLTKGPGSFDDPSRLLEMQMEVYKLAQNVEIMSRTVSEATSGVKTILQTQV